MSKFESVTLVWEGKEYHIPPDRIMGAILVVEDFVTIDQIFSWREHRKAPLGKIAAAYAAVLRYAGAKAEDSDVYSAMFSGNKAEEVTMALQLLLRLMLPPADVIKGGVAKAAKGKKKVGNSSKKPTSPQPPKDG